MLRYLAIKFQFLTIIKIISCKFQNKINYNIVYFIFLKKKNVNYKKLYNF